MGTFGVSPGGMWRGLMDMGTYLRTRRGLWTYNVAEDGAFLRAQPGLCAPGLRLHMVTALVDDHGRKMHFTQGYSCHVCLLRPRSRGSVQLASANPDDLPLIDPAFLDDPQDMEDMVAGYKVTRNIMEAPSLKRWMQTDMFTENVNSD